MCREHAITKSQAHKGSEQTFFTQESKAVTARAVKLGVATKVTTERKEKRNFGNFGHKTFGAPLTEKKKQFVESSLRFFLLRIESFEPWKENKSLKMPTIQNPNKGEKKSTSCSPKGEEGLWSKRSSKTFPSH